jgi:hypothetical protein
MNDNNVSTTENTEGKTARGSRNLVLVIVVAVGLVAAGLFLLPQISASPGCAGEGACMLYFYTDD